MTPSAETLLEAKRTLRQAVIRRRDGVPPAERAARSGRICERVANSPEFERARVVLLFASFGSEVDTGPLLHAALAAGKRLVLPRVDPGTRRLELREVRSLSDGLAPGTWGIPEPVPGRCAEVALDAVQLMLVPGVAFDRGLRRLGYGGGYYDRLLADLSQDAAAIAVCFDLQVVPEVPADERDLPVPVLITETERIERP